MNGTATKARVPLAMARELADKLLAELRPFCEQIEVAGSIRRGKAHVGDIELVAIPRVRRETIPVQIGLFGEGTEPRCRETSLLDAALLDLVNADRLKREPPGGIRTTTAWGENYKKLWAKVNDQRGWVQVDLFITDADRWGAIYTIRTGPGDFSQALVTHIKQRTPYRQQGGYLRQQDAPDEIIPVRTEAAYFEAVGVPYIPPGKRSVEALRAALRSLEPKGPVIHVRDAPEDWAGCVYIGRRNKGRGLAGSKWANPFHIGPDGDRATVIAKFRAYLMDSPDLLRAIPELVGKTLACWCAPQACHGDVLADLATRYARGAWSPPPLVSWDEVWTWQGGRLAVMAWPERAT